MLGAPDWRQQARDLHADYLYWGPREEAEFGKSAQPWKKSCVRVADGDWGTIFDIGENSGHLPPMPPE
jgi:hypothetical protein